jgi:hypothetical protein
MVDACMEKIIKIKRDIDERLIEMIRMAKKRSQRLDDGIVYGMTEARSIVERYIEKNDVL